MVDATQYTYPFDRTGTAVTNKVGPERHTLTSVAWTDYNIVIPKAAPFFAPNYTVKYIPTGQMLVHGVDYIEGWYFDAASGEIGARVYGCIMFYDNTLDGEVELVYQTLGGPWTLNDQQLAALLAQKLTNPILTRWEQVVELPFEFPPLDHEHDVEDLTTLQDLLDKLEEIRQAILTKTGASLDEHIANKNNPHAVTAAQVGLGLVPNYPLAQLADIAVGTLTSNRLMNPPLTNQMIQNIAIAALNTHIADKTNPHGTTKSQVGLGSVDNFATATASDIVAGATATNKFTTPNIVEAMITAIALTALANHANDFTNPHRTSAAQVGAYTKQETLTAIQDAISGSTGTLDAATLQGYSRQQLTDDILARCQTLINASAQDITTQVLAIVQAQPASDSLKFGGQTPAEWEAKIGGGGAGSLNFQLYDALTGQSAATWTKFATFSPVKNGVTVRVDPVLYISGGCAQTNLNPSNVMVILDWHDITKSKILAMGTVKPDWELWVVDQTATEEGNFVFYLKGLANRNAFNVFLTEPDTLEFADADVVTAQPVGAVKLTSVDGFALTSEMSQLVQGLGNTYDNATGILNS